MSKPQKSTVKEKRFSKAFVWAHAVNAISFFALYITALPMYTEVFDWLYPVLGGPEGARLLHRIFWVGVHFTNNYLGYFRLQRL